MTLIETTIETFAARLTKVGEAMDLVIAAKDENVRPDGSSSREHEDEDGDELDKLEASDLEISGEADGDRGDCVGRRRSFVVATTSAPGSPRQLLQGRVHRPHSRRPQALPRDPGPAWWRRGMRSVAQQGLRRHSAALSVHKIPIL
jgi:hypothetical protein